MRGGRHALGDLTFMMTTDAVSTASAVLRSPE
jgi:hypothetical protein